MDINVHTVVSRAEAPTVQELMAPFFLGLLVNYFLWGIQITQTYYYYKTFRKTDNEWPKLIVALLFLMDIVQSISASKSGWGFMVEKWGELNKVALLPDWGIHMMPLADTLTASIVHVFYAHKIWVLLRYPYNLIFTAIVISLSLLQLTAGTGCSIFQFVIEMPISQFNRINTWVGIWLATASATDVVITVVMTWKLSNSRTGFRRTDDIVTKLIKLIVETGLATAVVQIIDLVVFLTWPLKPYHSVPTYIAPKVYSNSVLAVLNSREARAANERRGPHNQVASSESETVQTLSFGKSYALQDRMKYPSSHPGPPYDERTVSEMENASPYIYKEPA